MKKLIFVLSMMLCVPSFAAWMDNGMNNLSSFTKTNEGAISVASTTLTRGGCILVGVVVASPSAGGSITFADDWVPSTGAVTYSTIAVLSLWNGGNTANGPVGPFYIPYQIRTSSGLMYMTSGNAGGVNIIYAPIH